MKVTALERETVASDAARLAYQRRLARVRAAAQAAMGGRPQLRKRTISNRFRYDARPDARRRTVELGDFNHVLALDTRNRTLDVEGLITYRQVVEHTLAQGLLPTVAPELKHITVGGAIVGIGIESSCFRHGFVHDGLLEADVLLPDGSVVTCSPENEYADLFHGLPNSYGTLGYILRARLALVPARAFTQITNRRLNNVEAFLAAMQEASTDPALDFVEALFYSDNELYLTTGRMSDTAPATRDIYRNVYYRFLSEDTTFYLRTLDYIFRYDPDWFWNVPEGGWYDVFRRYAPRSMRNSGFYDRYVGWRRRLDGWLPGASNETDEEPLIQDWELPWEQAAVFIRYALEQVDLEGRPWVGVPIRTPRAPTHYPVRPDTLYFNLGCYCHTRKPKPDVDYYYTRILDRKCFELGGIKMLYSSTFLGREEFDRIYNGRAYAALKRKYDPACYAPTLFEKTVGG